MTPLKILRKIGKFLRGGAAGPQIVLASTLGLMLGFTVGFNATVLILILLLVLLNTAGFITALAILEGKLLSLLLAPGLLRLGYVVIHKIGLEGAFRAASGAPVLAWMKLENYCQTGGLLVAVVLGVVQGVLLHRYIQKLRTALAVTDDKSERYKKFANNKVAKFMTTMLFGKQKKTMEEMLQKKQPMIRKGGVVVFVVLLGLIVAANVLLNDAIVKAGLQDGLAGAVGAEVNIDSAEFSLAGGRLAVSGLQITDPNKPTHNLLQAAELRTDVSFGELLRKRFTLDAVTLDTVRLDQPRAAAGWVKESANQERQNQWSQNLPPDLLVDYFQKAQEYRKSLPELKKVQRWMEQRDENAGEDEPVEPTLEELLRTADVEGYRAMTAESILAAKPLWTIVELHVKQVLLPDDPTPYDFTGKWVSAQPDLNRKIMLLEVRQGEQRKFAVSLNYTDPSALHEMAASVKDLVLEEGMLSDKAPVSINKGVADLLAKGTIDPNALDIPFELNVRDLDAGTRPGRGIAGASPEQSQEWFKYIKEIKLVGSIQGTLSKPRLVVTEEQLAASIQAALKSAGKAVLADQAGKQLQQLGGENGKLLKDVGGLLGGQTPAKDQPAEQPAPAPEDAPQDEEQKKPGLLDGLLGK